MSLQNISMLQSSKSGTEMQVQRHWQQKDSQLSTMSKLHCLPGHQQTSDKSCVFILKSSMIGRGTTSLQETSQ